MVRPDRDEHEYGAAAGHSRAQLRYIHQGVGTVLAAMVSRTVLITGANRGLGLETARQLAARDHVILTARDAASGREAAAAISPPGHAVEFRQLDVTDSADIDRIAG